MLQTAMMVPFVRYEVNFQFFWPTAPTRSITMNPNSCENAKALTTVFGAGRSAFGLNPVPFAGRAESRLSPPLPATKVAGWLLEEVERLEIVHVAVHGDPDVRRVVVARVGRVHDRLVETRVADRGGLAAE